MIRTFEPREDGSCCQHQQYITSRAHSCQCAKDSILAPAPECLQAVAARGHLPMGLECPTTHPQPALHSYHKLLTKLAHMYTYQCVHIVHSGIVHIWLQRHLYGASINSSNRWENTYKIINSKAVVIEKDSNPASAGISVSDRRKFDAANASTMGVEKGWQTSCHIPPAYAPEPITHHLLWSMKIAISRWSV